ncbi:glutathione-dependent disulfide-bond oxidoreductase [Streptococcus hongkongensis]|nr:S-transferase [Streptococcus uberis]
MTTYQLPKVWTNTYKIQGSNQETAGSRFEQVLPKGENPYQLYTLGTPNGIKPIILFEELKEIGKSGVSYDAFKISLANQEQFGSDFTKINPNSKIPALLDLTEAEELNVFESANILLYLAEKHGAFISKNHATRTQELNWLFWQTGAAPFVGGGFGHFFHYAPEKLEYPIDRYTMETKRQLDLLDQELAKRPYIAGQDYSIADIAIWSWYGQLVQDKLYDNAAEFLDGQTYKNLNQWAEKIAQRPAVKRALEVSLKDIN